MGVTPKPQPWRKSKEIIAGNEINAPPATNTNMVFHRHGSRFYLLVFIYSLDKHLFGDCVRDNTFDIYILQGRGDNNMRCLYVLWTYRRFGLVQMSILGM